MKEQKQRKPTKLEALSASVAHEYKDQNTLVINSRVRVLEFEATEADRSIVALQAALQNMRDRRAKIEAVLAGLATIAGKR